VLIGTRVTDAGLEHLKGLTDLKILLLVGTPVTDAGLDHLKGLAKLEFVNLSGTQVTEKGIEELQKALPDLSIHRTRRATDSQRPTTSPEAPR
jgi:hypothetical protein